MRSLVASALSLTLLTATPAKACDLALVLAVDISGSVDHIEYAIQMQGLANGLRDGIVSEALVRANAWVTVVQWSGTSRQTVAVGWTAVNDFEAVEAFANAVEHAPRAWRDYSTAVGEALRFSATQFDNGPICKRRVIDVSGDGRSNEGTPPLDVHPELRKAEITVNALVIEGAEEDLTAYFWENVIMGDGAFVVTANGFNEYPERMQRKLIRETTEQVSSID
ncbi:DUF1194 domain-containing protein [Aliiroseovarius sp. YM-037]|uniref:DUF1194 domain-containing protein n=1 Tax=Aliiroseovarius sp. YM-037 TaxID=3341728 RepID=UPI003A805685